MNSMKDLEIEIKFALKNPKKVISKLGKIAKTDKKDVYQKDTYYIPSHRNFLKQIPVKEWLRIRESENGFMVNYKNWYTTKKKDERYCDEYETSFEDLEAMKNIFKALDIEEVVVVEKNRNTWHYKDCEVAIDKVTNLGWFVELEIKGKFDSVDEAVKHLYKVLEELDAELGKEDKRGYPYRLLEKKGYEFEEKKEGLGN